MERDLLDILLDAENREPIVLTSEDGKSMTFEQVAVIPKTVKGERRLYAILKPADKIHGVAEDEAIVFLVDTDDEGYSVLKVETDEKIAAASFEEYYKLLAKSEE